MTNRSNPTNNALVTHRHKKKKLFKISMYNYKTASNNKLFHLSAVAARAEASKLIGPSPDGV